MVMITPTAGNDGGKHQRPYKKLLGSQRFTANPKWSQSPHWGSHARILGYSNSWKQRSKHCPAKAPSALQ